MSDSVLVDRKEHLTVITINRPERLNAIDPDTAEELGRVFEAFEVDDDQWAAILTGSGRAFCTGNDLVALASADHDQPAQPGTHGFGFASITKRFPLYKPVIAAINGFALAGGLEIALVCDILIAAESAKLGLTEVRWALMPTGGGTQRLPRAIPTAWARYLILTGDQITAAQAREIGLITHVIPDDLLMEEAHRIGGLIVERGPLAVRAAKEAMLRGADLPLEQALAYEDLLGLQVAGTRDAQEGARAFSEKRPPEFLAR